MRVRLSSNDESLAHAAELANAINFLIMDTSTAVIQNEMEAYVPQSPEAEISREQKVITKTSGTGDFTHEPDSDIFPNGGFIDKGRTVLNRCDSRDSFIYMERSNHSIELQEPMRDNLELTENDMGPSLLFSDIENFIAEDSSHLESATAQLQAQRFMPENHSVVAAFVHPTVHTDDDDRSLYSPEHKDSVSTTLSSYKPTLTNKLKRSKVVYSTPEFVSSSDEDSAHEAQAAVGQTQVPTARSSPPMLGSRKYMELGLPRKNMNNCCRKDDDDSHSSSTTTSTSSCSNSSSSSSSSGDSSSHRNVVENKQAMIDRHSREYHNRRRRSIVASKTLSIGMQKSSGSEDEDDEESSAYKQRRKSERVRCGNVHKIGGKFVVRLKETKDSVDPPKRPILPKIMSSRVAKLTRRPVIVKGSSLTFPNVTFYEGDDEDDEVSYDKKLGLVALKSLVPEVRLAPSTVGKLLKHYSQKEETYFMDMHKISNYKTDLISYPLVYGAVPRSYSSAAKYFIKKCVHLVNMVTRKIPTTTSLPSMGGSGKEAMHKQGSARETVPLHDGEIEIITYCYWQLTTQDLIKWHDDLPRRRVKQIFEYAWVSMRDSISKAWKRDNPIKSNLIRVKNALEIIRRYAEFDKPNRLTAACLFMIKEHYDVIIPACRELSLDPSIWEYILRLCGVHHYLCSHTLTEIVKRIPQVSKILKYRLLEIEAQTSDCVVQPLSRKAVFKMFGRWIVRPSHVTSKLQQATNNLFFAECRGFGLHVVRFGIWRSDVIYPEHVAGYADIRKTAMQVLELPPLSQINVRRAINLVNDTVNNAVANCGGKMHKIKISIGATKEFEKYLLYRFSSAIIGVTQCRPRGTMSTEWAKLFVEAIDNFIDASSKDVHHVDDWSLTDDCDLDEYDDYGMFKRSFAEQYHENFEDSESDSDHDVDYEEGLDDEIEELRRGYPDLVEKTYSSQPVAIVCGNNKTPKRPKLIETEMQYKFSEEKISRVKCVLCFTMTTGRTIILEAGMRVACCKACHFALNTDSTVNIEALKRRVREKVKAPIGFRAEGEIREFLALVDETVKTRLSFNRDAEKFGAKLQKNAKDPAVPSNNSSKRKPNKDHVDSVTKAIEIV